MNADIIAVLIILISTAIMFIFDLFRVDVIAMISMIALAWSGVLSPQEAVSGFSSNAVISIIGIMVMGRGIYRTGIMEHFSRTISSITSGSQKGIIGTVSIAVGSMSAFMQNIGSAALFLPVLIRLSKKYRLPASKMLMPMGFAAILGGTLSMVGSGPLIILNDLFKQKHIEPYGLFSVTPVGIVLLLAGVMFFITLGSRILQADSSNEQGFSKGKDFGLDSQIFICRIGRDSGLIGKKREDIPDFSHKAHLIGVSEEGKTVFAPWRHTAFHEGGLLALMGNESEIEKLSLKYKMERMENVKSFDELKSDEKSGFAEILIPYKSRNANKTLRDIALRKNYNVEPVMLISGNSENRSDFSDVVLLPGNIIIVYGRWENIADMSETGDFVIATRFEYEKQKKHKAITAGIIFTGAIMAAIMGIQLSLALLSGALLMIITGVIDIEEAYKAIDWRTVFLLAGLIPLGIAMEKSGAAAMIAGNVIEKTGTMHMLLFLTSIALLSTLFSLFMSNVAATVLLVPLIISLAGISNLDPRPLALLIAVNASNSFILPTHQVNAFLMSAGGYRNRDYLKMGSIMTLIFIIISVFAIYLFYL